MKSPFQLALLLLLIVAVQRLPAQGSGIRLRHAAPVAVAGQTGSAGSIVASSLAGEPVQAGRAAGGAFILSSGARIPDGVARLLQYALASGWQLLGAPGVSDLTVGEVFVGAAGATVKVGPIQYYNSDTLRYSQAGNDEQLQARRGFWLFSYWGGQSQTFTATRDITTGDWLSEIPAGRWVLYSPPGRIILAGSPGVTIYTWHPDTQSYGAPLQSGDILLPLHGYWVYRTEQE